MVGQMVIKKIDKKRGKNTPADLEDMQRIITMIWIAAKM
jgi:hypothetical protein